MEENKSDALSMLIKHELAIKTLYEIFATRFKTHESFWRDLAVDEQRHADWLIELQSNISSGKWHMRESRLKPQAIKTSIGYVESQVAKARQENPSLLQALSIARDIESALLERQFLKPNDSDPKEVRAVLTGLTTETEKHLQKVLEAFTSEKQKSA